MAGLVVARRGTTVCLWASYRWSGMAEDLTGSRLNSRVRVALSYFVEPIAVGREDGPLTFERRQCVVIPATR